MPENKKTKTCSWMRYYVLRLPFFQFSFRFSFLFLFYQEHRCLMKPISKVIATLAQLPSASVQSFRNVRLTGPARFGNSLALMAFSDRCQRPYLMNHPHFNPTFLLAVTEMSITVSPGNSIESLKARQSRTNSNFSPEWNKWNPFLSGLLAKPRSTFGTSESVVHLTSGLNH